MGIKKYFNFITEKQIITSFDNDFKEISTKFEHFWQTLTQKLEEFEKISMRDVDIVELENNQRTGKQKQKHTDVHSSTSDIKIDYIPKDPNRGKNRDGYIVDQSAEKGRETKIKELQQLKKQQKQQKISIDDSDDSELTYTLT